MKEQEGDIIGSIQEIAANTRQLQHNIQEVIDKLRKAIAVFEKGREPNLCKQSEFYWAYVMHVDALVRIRLFTEQNFNYLESMSVLSMTRYIFELMIWLRLIKEDRRYCLIYYNELLLKQLKYYEDLRDHLNGELSFFKEIAAEESLLLQKRLGEAKAITDSELRIQALRRLGGDVMSEIDAAAARKFTIYGEQGKRNGYDYEAHFIEKQMLPNIEKAIGDIEKEQHFFRKALPSNVKTLIGKKWIWSHQAKLAGMGSEFNFIYSYTSRLLHATPASLTTNKKNLEPDEMLLFLRYIYIRMVDIIEMASSILPIGEE
jgi:tetratricopeptide (TPR) repeat protein